MFEHESEPIICYNCDEEFVVRTPYETDGDVCFCPFCGSEVDSEEYDEDDDDDYGNKEWMR